MYIESLSILLNTDFMLSEMFKGHALDMSYLSSHGIYLRAAHPVSLN